jgi:hypothetical protein
MPSTGVHGHVVRGGMFFEEMVQSFNVGCTTCLAHRSRQRALEVTMTKFDEMIVIFA